MSFYHITILYQSVCLKYKCTIRVLTSVWVQLNVLLNAV